MSSAYTSQSSWDLYRFLVFDQNISEGICDALLAVSETMRQFASGTSTLESALVELDKHISQQTFKFVKDGVPDLVQDQRGSYKNVWSNRYLASTSQGLKQSIEKITMRFIENLTKLFSKSLKGWTYIPDLVHDAFKELAVSFEDALSMEYDDRQKTVEASAAKGVAILSESLYTLSISGSQSAASVTPARSLSSDDCFKCDQPGHRSSECPQLRRESTTPSKSPPNIRCYNCSKTGHWARNCPSPQKGSITPLRSSASSQSGNCYTCGQPGHWSSGCPSHERVSATTPSRTPSQTPSSDKCFSCGQMGHWANNCPRRRPGSHTPSRSSPRDECFSCGNIGHWSSNCPTRRN